MLFSSQSTPPGDGTGLSCNPAPTADVQHFHRQTDAYCKDQGTWDMKETLHSKSALSSACHEHTSLPTPGLRHPLIGISQKAIMQCLTGNTAALSPHRC